MSCAAKMPPTHFLLLWLHMTSAAILELYRSEKSAVHLLRYGTSIYVGGQNLILKFRNSIISNETLDNIAHLPCKDPLSVAECNESPTNISIFMSYKLRNDRFVLTCTAEDAGSCYLLNSTNLSFASDLSPSTDNFDPHQAYIGSKTSAVAVQIPLTKYIFSAISDANMTSHGDVYTFSERWVSNNILKYKGSKSMYIQSKPGTMFDFVAGYISGDYVHFLWNIKYPTVTKAQINQLCTNDYFFRSYIETDLECGTYKTLKSAVTLSMNGTIFLLTSFSSESHGTDMCLFKAADIDAHFKSEMKNCFQGISGTRPNWIDGENKTVCKSKIDKEAIHCGETGTNTRIHTGGRIRNNPFYQTSIKEADVTSQVFYQFNNIYAVGYIGHSNGTVTKLLLNTYNSTYYILYSVNATDNGQPLGKDLILSETKDKLFFTYGNMVVALKVDDCGLLTSCQRCLAEVTPCMWTNGTCASRTDVNGITPHTFTRYCPPQIEVTTLFGPVEGGTEVTVRGMMGRPGSHVTIRLGNLMINKTISIGESEIRFNSSAVPEPQSVKIIVSVTPPSGVNVQREIWDIDINGTTENLQPFVFREVDILHSGQQHALISGGAGLILKGQYLNIGSHKRVQIGNQKCSNARYFEKYIICKTPSRIGTGRINVTYHVDNALVTGPEVEFVNDPVIRKIHPTIVIRRQFGTSQPTVYSFSGGVPIQFEGDNLRGLGHGITIGSLYGTLPDSNSRKGYCSFQGDKLKCDVPAFQMSPDLNDTDSENVTLTFFNAYGRLSGVHFTDATDVMSIVPDPKLDFCEVDSQQLSGPVETTFTGRNFDNIELTHINILTGKQKCEILEKTDAKLKCKTGLKVGVEWTPLFNVAFGKNLGFNISCITLRQPARSVPGLVENSHQVMYPTLAALAVLVACTVCVLVWRLRSRRKRKMDLPYNVYFRREGEEPLSMEDIAQREATSQNVYQMDIVSDQSSAVASDTWIGVDTETKEFLKSSNLLVPKEYITLAELIGQGNFGRVYKGFMKTADEKEDALVAVKTLHRSNPKDMDVEKFLSEALIMRDFHHPNVMTLVGICVGMEKLPLVILPYMKMGDLLTYIRDVNNVPTVRKLVEFGVDIASGMDYLSGLKFVHRDLAARNCMIADDLTVKVADFGLSRDVYEKEYYSSCDKKTMLPVKWMSPESLEYGMFNYKTDIWSFGVVLWELLTRGMNPYPAVDNWDVLRYLKDGRRLDKPDYCPEGMYKIMRSCWDWEPEDRPAFKQLMIDIPELLRFLERASQRK